MVESVPEQINFPREEVKVLALWKEWDVFRTCLKQSKGKPRYTFYDGPPFATGLPHYGHILAGTIKDIVTRYAHMNGFFVERRFGWDCHGLPVEYEIDKSLGLTGPKDVMKMGIDKYNDACREIVMRYAKDWEYIVGRMGRWIDFENDYKTLYPWFMETVWWVFKQLYDKGLVYRGFKVMPFSTACNTPLSNFESGQNYKEVVDPAVVVSFPLDEDPTVAMVAWTTTPWTLPSNMALCVNAALDYVKVQEKSTGKSYILMECRLSSLFKTEDEYEVTGRFKGSELAGKSYTPLLPYYANLKANGAFVVLTDSYVTEETGTGVVHQAPYFGEDDYRVCLAAGVITKDQDMICPVDESGRFTAPVSDFEGQYVKDADKNIVKLLISRGRLVQSGTTKHNYPFCWRSDTPLIYRAVPSWFIRVEGMSDRLLKNNQATYWVPDFVKEKRFANWLKDARDWAVSRNRYWGTPIPLWVSEDMEEVVCIGSMSELESLSGIKVTDLHREHVDQLEIPSSRPGHPPLKRVSEVFDCWFESGSMPYAQVHYPFEHRKEFEDSFPADFIAEGIDQTRGWFYTLLVLSTALFDKPPFKNLVVNGLVLASDGQKMSKRKKNYPDPIEVVEKYGADALRLYLINSPVVRAENLRFKEEGVCDVLKDVFLPWYNAYRFLVQNVQRMQTEEGVIFSYSETAEQSSPNVMDQWISSSVQSLLVFVKAEMEAYRLYTVVPRLVRFIDQLTNWYVRMNRRRLKGEGGLPDCRTALETLFGVLYAMVRVMAPFTPFLTETLYQNLRRMLSGYEPGTMGEGSVHYLPIPTPRPNLIKEEIERAVSRMQSVVEVGRVIRDRRTMPLKYPLSEVVVIQESEECLEDIRRLERYVLEELNVRRLTLTTEKKGYGVGLRAEPDHKVLGARLKGAFKAVLQAVKNLTDADLESLVAKGSIEVEGHVLSKDDLHIKYSFTSETSQLCQKYEAHSDNDILVLMDMSPDQSLLDEGIAREITNRVQKLRKKAHLVPLDVVSVYHLVTPATSDLARVAREYADFIQQAIKAPFLEEALIGGAGGEVIIQEVMQVKGADLKLVIIKGQSNAPAEASTGTPVCRYANVELSGVTPRLGIKGTRGTILLENPRGDRVANASGLGKELATLFGLHGVPLEIYVNGKCVGREGADDLSGKTLVVCRRGGDGKAERADGGTFCRFVNVDHDGKCGTTLLENPVGDVLSSEEVYKAVSSLFGVPVGKFELFDSPDKKEPLSTNGKLLMLSGKTLYLGCK